MTKRELGEGKEGGRWEKRRKRKREGENPGLDNVRFMIFHKSFTLFQKTWQSDHVIKILMVPPSQNKMCIPAMLFQTICDHGFYSLGASSLPCLCYFPTEEGTVPWSLAQCYSPLRKLELWLLSSVEANVVRGPVSWVVHIRAAELESRDTVWVELEDQR